MLPSARSSQQTTGDAVMWLMWLWLKLSWSERWPCLRSFIISPVFNSSSLLNSFLPRLMWLSVNREMFSLGKDVKNNSLDSKEPGGREERTPQDWRMKQQKYSEHARRTEHFLSDGWKQSHIWVVPAKFVNNSKNFSSCFNHLRSCGSTVTAKCPRELHLNHACIISLK